MKGIRMNTKRQYVRLLGWLSGHKHEAHEAPNHNETLWIQRAGSSDLVCALNSESPSDQVWLGLANKWLYFYSGREFRKMAAWVLWRWIWGDWCGLKTRLWFWTLRQRLHK